MPEKHHNLGRPFRFLVTLIPGLELRVLALLIGIGGGIWAFIELADEVLGGDTKAFDKSILLAMRNPADFSDPLGPRWFEDVVRDVTALGGIALLSMISLAVIGYLLLQRKKGMAVYLLASVGGGLLLSVAMKYGFDRSRPDLVPHGSHVMTASFPSGHSMLSAVIYFTLGGLLALYTPQKRLKIFILSLSVLVTLLVGLSRIYLGVHWPTDVLAGWTAGASWALLCWLIAHWLKRRGQIEQDMGG